MNPAGPLIEEIELVIRGIDGREASIVLVLESVLCPSPWNGTTVLEGSRFGAYLTALAKFASLLVRPKRVGNRRLPGTTQRNAALSSGCKRIENQG
jgi:hypothetical protein